MALNIATKYPGKSSAPSAGYPYGSARNITAPGDGTGTPLEAAWLNDLLGWQQAMLSEAEITPSGLPDTATASQYLTAAKVILGAVPRSLTALKALIPYVAGQSAFLAAEGRSGSFVWRVGDYSTQVAEDTENGIYVKADAFAASVGCWVRETNGLFLAKWFGVVDGETSDQTTKIQAFLDAIPNYVNAKISGQLTCGNVLLSNKTGVTLDGSECKLTLSGTASADTKLGLQLSGTLTRVKVFGFDIQCDGVLANAHAGVFSQSGVVMTDVEICYNVIRAGVNGISANSDLSGSQIRTKIYRNIILGTTGTASGEGYGIHFADGSGVVNDAEIYQNYVAMASRHSIYFAKGLKGAVYKNRIFRHRYAQKTSQFRAAIQCLRSSDVDIYNNTLVDPSDCGIFIGKSGLNGKNCKAFNNTFDITSEALATVPLVAVGSTNPAALDPDIDDGETVEGAPSDVSVLDNVYNIDNNTVECLRINCALGVKAHRNTGVRKNTAGSPTVINLRFEGLGLYNSSFSLFDNDITQAAGALVFIDDNALSAPTRVDVGRNRGGDANMFGGTSPTTGIDLRVFDQDITGLSSATCPGGRYQLTKTFVGVLTTGELAPGVAATYNASFPNVKKGDVAAVSIPEIGTRSFILSAHANSDNNVRLVVFNAGAVPGELVSQDLIIQVNVNR